MIAYIIGTMDDSDDRAFMEALYQNFERLMFSAARKYISNLPDQKDVVQDGMEKLMKKVTTIRPMMRCVLASYIVYTIRSTSIDFLRGQKKLAEHNVNLEEQQFSELWATTPPLDDLIISAERLAFLRSVWPDLPEEDRILLEGKYALGYKDVELATKLDCKPSSIRMKLTRARRRAFKRLTEKEEV